MNATEVTIEPQKLEPGHLSGAGANINKYPAISRIISSDTYNMFPNSRQVLVARLKVLNFKIIE